MDCGMGMRAVRAALCRIWIAVGTCSCSEYKECSYSHSSMRTPVLQCASIMKHVSRFTFLTPADIYKNNGLLTGLQFFMNYERNIAISLEVDADMTYTVYRLYRQLPRASSFTSHCSSTAVLLSILSALLIENKVDLTTVNFFQAAP